METRRTITFFEKILLFVGIFLAIIGFYVINSIYKSGGEMISYDMLSVVFLWIILLFLVIIAAISENQREEARLIDKELHKETALLREIIKDQLLEMKLLREDIIALHKIEKTLNQNNKGSQKLK